MSATIELPIWLFILVAVLAALSLVNHFFLPGARWFLRRRVNRAIEEMNTRLKLELPTFQLTKREVLIDRLTFDPEVMKTVETVAAERAIPRDAVMAEVVAYAREMVPAFNAFFYIRIGYWLTRRLIRGFYRVRLGYADEQTLGGIDPDSAIVFFMNHRSNMDYLLVTYLASRASVLSFGAGEWARVWPFVHLLRTVGAYIVRRDTRDPLYRKVLERYVQMATDACVPHAVFAEGQLSRDGLLGKPKLGLLGYIIKDFDPGGNIDVLFIPVGINFDRVAEERTLIRDKDADFTGRSGLYVLYTTVYFLIRQVWYKFRSSWHGYGTACASFGAPVSLKAWLKDHQVDLRKLEKAERFEQIARLADDLMKRVAQVIPVLPVPLVAMTIRDAADASLSELDIRNRAQMLMSELHEAGAHIAIQEGNEDHAIAEAFQTLLNRGLIREAGDGHYVANPADVPLLDYYANSIAHLR